MKLFDANFKYVEEAGEKDGQRYGQIQDKDGNPVDLIVLIEARIEELLEESAKVAPKHVAYLKKMEAEDDDLEDGDFKNGRETIMAAAVAIIFGVVCGHQKTIEIAFEKLAERKAMRNAVVKNSVDEVVEELREAAAKAAKKLV